MTVAKPFPIASLATPPAGWRSRVRVEKIQLSNRLDGERHNARQQEGFAEAKLARTKLCRDGTAETAQEWDERILVSAFVAQVLAQAMNGAAPDAPSALPAYGRGNAPKIALFCDRRS